ncbi:MAG: enhanced serine sensitivity protein SseB C-terminal domain-containing protein [Gemmataceae bacterium]
MGLFDWFRQRPTDPPAKSPVLLEGVSSHQRTGPVFLGQQRGVAADLLHAEFRPALLGLPQVQRAYFCKLHYPGEARAGAAVCVASSTGEDLRVVEAVAAVIRANVESSSHIDILFLSPSLEATLSGVCEPFYNQAEPDAAANGEEAR